LRFYQTRAPPSAAVAFGESHPGIGQEAFLGVDVLMMIAMVMAVPGVKLVSAVINTDLLLVKHNS
jgi:hypothetical protein